MKTMKREKLRLYSTVVSSFQADLEHQLAKKVIANLVRRSNIDMEIASTLIARALEYIEVNPSLPPVPIAELKHELQRGETTTEKAIKVLQSLSVNARINNLQIWIPLSAERPDSQILNLSLVSDLSFEMKKT
jgi:hypothetical protein